MKKKLLLVLALGFTFFTSQASTYLQQTVLYSVKGTDSLYFDKYETLSSADDQRRPCIIFMFGGGFVSGTRDAELYIPYFEFLADQGYCVVSIDYRLGLKNIGAQQTSPHAFLELLSNAIDLAVDDLTDAINSILAYADEWNIDPDKIILNGSSAGAVAVLSAAYRAANDSSSSNMLPRDFKYAGVISFAGAVFRFTEQLQWDNYECPVMLFHGDADSNVPYGVLAEMGAGFFGSKYIADLLKNNNFPYYFYSVRGAGHEMATLPMNENREEINKFIREYVLEGKKMIIDVERKDLTIPSKTPPSGIMDYIKANFGI